MCLHPCNPPHKHTSNITWITSHTVTEWNNKHVFMSLKCATNTLQTHHTLLFTLSKSWTANTSWITNSHCHRAEQQTQVFWSLWNPLQTPCKHIADYHSHCHKRLEMRSLYNEQKINNRVKDNEVQLSWNMQMYQTHNCTKQQHMELFFHQQEKNAHFESDDQSMHVVSSKAP